MKIVFANGTELNLTEVTGGPIHFQGAKRDVLNFIFPGAESLEVLDKAFTDVACESVTIVGDDGSADIHKGYVIRVKMDKSIIELSPADSENAAVVEERITVSMAQRTYAETQLASLTETVDALVMESLMA